MEGARIGIGRDIHRLVPGRVLTLGGVAVPAEVGFATPPDSHPAAAGARSVDYVSKMASHLLEADLVVEHIDSLVTLGTVRLGAHLNAMRACLAEALAIPRERVSVKARSNDGIGPEGRGEAASATVAVLLRAA